MTYGQTGTSQVYDFLTFFSIGFLTGFFYRAVELVRMLFHESKKVRIFFDVFFSFVCTVMFFFALLVCNDARIRLNLMLSGAAGFGAFQLFFGDGMKRLSEVLSRIIKKTGGILLFPFFALLKLLRRLFKGLFKKSSQSKARKKAEAAKEDAVVQELYSTKNQEKN